MKLRKMTMADAELMLEWKNYPETRKFAIVSHKKIKKEDHLKWLKKNLKYFQIFEVPVKTVVGAVRVQDKEVSIWVDRDFWNYGIAFAMLHRVTKEGYTAKIVNGNVPSMRVFIKAGYKPVSYQNGYYTFQKQ